MKILVLSDLHGRVDRAERVLSLHRDADEILFLGDGVRECSSLMEKMALPWIGVRGNCDLFSRVGEDVPEERMLLLGGFKILMTHGHRLGVKHGIGAAAAYAVSRGADILLYGHTHVAEERCLSLGEASLWVMNPGSIGEPRGGEPSYGLIQIQGNSILLSHGRA